MNVDPKEVSECMLEIPEVVARACIGLPPGVIALNIAEAVQELAEKLNQG
ncbi:MAG: hypothetical protein M0021_09905 [Clostridia bacterium]|nr:hypothetical protein [Clostridia bacterium]